MGLVLIAYLGMIVPAVGMGIATGHVAATTSMSWFTGILLVLLAGVAAVLIKSIAAAGAPKLSTRVHTPYEARLPRTPGDPRVRGSLDT